MTTTWTDDDTMALLKRIFNRTMLAENVAREEKADGARLKHIYEGAFADIRALTQEFPLARVRAELEARSQRVPVARNDDTQEGRRSCG